jgi:hypothetical protein
MFFHQSAVVLLGNLNPAIFHPEWFRRYKILPIQETQWSEGEKPKSTVMEHNGRKIVIQEVPPLIVKPDFADLHFPSLRVVVTPERYECSTVTRAHFSEAHDVTAKVFSILQHKPVKALGINFHGHCRFKTDTRTILHDLFSKENGTIRNMLGEEYEISGSIMTQDDGRQRTITLENSMAVPDALHCSVNIHRDVESRQAVDAIELLKNNYKNDLEDAIIVLEKLIGAPENLWEPKEP